jgi:hypothetical protein
MGRLGKLAVGAAILLSARSASAQVVVNPASGRVSIRASGQPVASLLDQLAQKTGMTVEYEKSPPRQGVTVAVEDRTPAQAVVAILEGLNIPYALSLTPDGLRVQTLVLADAAPPPKGAHPRVGRETSMAPPDEPAEAQVEQPGAEGGQVEVPPEQQVVAPADGVQQQRRGVPPAPPMTLAPAFPNSPFGSNAGAGADDIANPKAEAPVPEQPPQPPQLEKEPQV